MSTDERTTVFFLLGSGIGSMMGYLGYLFFFASKPDSELTRAINLAQRIRECTEIIGKHEEDIAQIRSALNQCNLDIVANNSEMEHRPLSYQFFSNIQFGRLENRIEMANTITSLLSQYPRLSTGTLDELNATWDEREKHHENIMSLVKEYLPETYACLNEAKINKSSGTLTI
jgi:hypothetical protein